jgi:hypothetical protein
MPAAKRTAPPATDSTDADQRYPGYGQCVLEIPYRWTARHGVGTDDVFEFDPPRGGERG